MDAVWFENGRAEYRPDIPVPEPPPGWALVRVRVAGVCGTDRQLLNGYANFSGIAGHEFVGDVVEGSREWRGRRVVADINVGCGDCGACAVSAHHCPSRRVLGIRELHGAFAEFLVIPEANLVEVPGHLDDSTAALAEPVAAALRVIDSLPPGCDRATVLGDGALGQLTAQALLDQGLDTIVIGRHDSKLQRLRELGIYVSRDLEGVGPSQFVVDCTGRRAGLAMALDLTAPRGTLVLKSTHARSVEVDLSRLVVNECRLVGSRCGNVAEAIAALGAGRIDASGLVDRKCSRVALPDALTRAGTPALKMQIS